MKGPAVLVTDGHLRPSLAIVRSLGRAGYRVCVCSPRAPSLASVSRYATAHARTPDPLTDPAAFVGAIQALIEAWEIRVLLPVSEEALLAILSVDRWPPTVVIPFAPLATFQRAADKQSVTALAATLGIAVPEQVVLQTAIEAKTLDRSHLSFPLVLKPARSVASDGTSRVKLGVVYARTAVELESLLQGLPAAAYPLLLQRKIRGPGTGVFFLIWEGRIVAEFAHRRVREKPPSGGVSVLSESVLPDQEALAQSRALLAALDWRGPAMVEFKRDERTGRHYLMEINGRFWGSLQLAIDSGVDFPALLVGLALGEPIGAVSSYRVGVRSRWWWGEVDHLLARFRGQADVPGLGPRRRALARLLWPDSRSRNEVLRSDDPWPFALETLDWFRGR